MNRLILATLIWAFSFSLIGHYIAGKMDLYLAVFLRLAIAFFIFLPFIKFKNIISKNSLFNIAIGSLQIGIMYIFYFKSFTYLSVLEVALFTVATPLYVSILGSFLEKKFKLSQLLHVGLVIFGALIIRWNHFSHDFYMGFLLVQGANLSFSLGQVFYKKYSLTSRAFEDFGLFYLGSLVPVTFMLLLFSNFKLSLISQFQWIILIWLGVIPTALGYYLWNTGSKQVSFGQLSVMNNAVIPMALVVNFIFWDKAVDWMTFIPGSLILLTGVVLESCCSQAQPSTDS